MKKSITIFLLLAVAVLPACRSKCAPLDRTYPSQRDNNKSTALDNGNNPGSNPERTTIAFAGGCADKKFAFDAKQFIGG